VEEHFKSLSAKYEYPVQLPEISTVVCWTAARKGYLFRQPVVAILAYDQLHLGSARCASEVLAMRLFRVLAVWMSLVIAGAGVLDSLSGGEDTVTERNDALRSAVRDGDLPVVQALLDGGADVKGDVTGEGKGDVTGERRGVATIWSSRTCSSGQPRCFAPRPDPGVCGGERRNVSPSAPDARLNPKIAILVFDYHPVFNDRMLLSMATSAGSNQDRTLKPPTSS
jgi:hypothetical protein